MKNKIKMLCIMLAVVTLLPFSGCKESTIDIAMIIADKGTFDDGNFHTSIWAGIEKICEEENLTCGYFEAENTNEDSFAEAIKQAVDQGADVLVTPGVQLNYAVFKAQKQYPDVSFIYVDGQPADPEFNVEVAKNTYALMYAEEQAGFLAGYAAVLDGYTKIGFYGGKQIPPVMRFGNGFVQGAEYAAAQMKLAEQSVEARYIYSGDFIAAPKHQLRANTWYKEGTQVIFACGGGVGESIMAAAKASGGYVIGVDVDQSGDSPGVVITSALKMLTGTVYQSLKSWSNDKFPGGKSEYIGAENDGVGLVMDTAIFKKFDNTAYNDIYKKIAENANGIRDGILKDTTAVEEIPLEYVKLMVEMP